MKFLCYSHNQQENESLAEINNHIKYRNDNLENNKESLNPKQFKLQQDYINNLQETLRAWHDILFGKYDDAEKKLISVKNWRFSVIS